MKKLTSQEASKTQPIKADWDAAWESVAPETSYATAVPEGAKSIREYAKEHDRSPSWAGEYLREQAEKGLLVAIKVKLPGRSNPVVYYQPKLPARG